MTLFEPKSALIMAQFDRKWGHKSNRYIQGVGMIYLNNNLEREWVK